MKKQIALIGAALVLAAVAPGCVGGPGTAYGFPIVPPGVIFSDSKFGGYVEENKDINKRPYEIIETVTGTARVTNVLLLVSTGDASNMAVERDALGKVKGADALINRTYDSEHYSILSLFTIVTNRVTGDAIRFTDKK